MAQQEKGGLRVWAGIGKAASVLVACAALITIILGVFALFDKLGWWTPPVVVHGEHSEFGVPSQFEKEAAKFWNDIDADGIAKALPMVDGSDRDRYSQSVTKYVRDVIPEHVIGQYGRGGLFKLNSVWKFVIVNGGKAEVKELVLDVPFAGICRIARRDGREELREIDKTVALENLRGGQGLVVTIWTNNPDSSTYEKDTRVSCPDWTVNADYEKRFRGCVDWFMIGPLGPPACIVLPGAAAIIFILIWLCMNANGSCAGCGGAADEGELAILRAIYEAGDAKVDVTEMVKGKVVEGKLKMKVSNENLGGDPAKGVVKVLRIEYSYHGKREEIPVPEGQVLVLPPLE
jgi:hypothetical protein